MKTLIALLIILANTAYAGQLRYTPTTGDYTNKTAVTVPLGGGTSFNIAHDYIQVIITPNSGTLPTNTVDDGGQNVPWIQHMNTSTYSEWYVLNIVGATSDNIFINFSQPATFHVEVDEVIPDAARSDASDVGKSLTDSSNNTWTFGASGSGGYLIYENGTYTSGNGLVLVYEGSTMYTLNSSYNWYKWSGSAWTQVSSTPNFTGSLYATPSSGILTAGCSNVMSFGSLASGGYHLLNNGADTNGQGYFYALGTDGNTYVLGSSSTWYKYGGGTTWTSVSTPSLASNILMPNAAKVCIAKPKYQ